jgi:hypothetical protein
MEDGAEDGLFELEEAGELQDLVSRVLSSGGRDAASVLPRYKQIVRCGPRRGGRACGYMAMLAA